MGDLALFSRDQLTKQLERSNLKFPALNVANGTVVPVVSPPGYEWENEVEVVQFSSTGIAVILAEGSEDGGKVGVVASRKRYPIKTVTDFTDIGYQTLQQAQAKGVDISGKYATALVEGVNKKLNAIGYDGDPDYGLYGFFTQAIPRQPAASTFAAASSADAMLTILNNAFTAIAVNNNTLGATSKIVTMPQRQHQLIGSTYFGASNPGKTVKTSFIEAQQSLGVTVKFVEDNSLVGKGTNGTDAMLITPYDETLEPDSPDHAAYLYVPLPFDLPADLSQMVGTNRRERAIARTGGLIVQDPFQLLIVEGI